MIISPFNSIFFLGSRKTDGLECPYLQTFSTTDVVMIEVIRTADEPAKAATLKNAVTGAAVNVLPRVSVSLGTSDALDCYTVSDVTDGIYFISIGDDDSESFRVTSDPAYLKNTIVIEYSAADNNSRSDVVGIADDERLYFTFRIPGGFKDSGWNFSIDNEQFVTDKSDIVELYARESVQQTLTMGLSMGVPIWFGELLNRLLTCRYVYIDGKRFARFGSSVPEMEQTLDGVNSFVFSQKLQRINHLEPTKI